MTFPPSPQTRRHRTPSALYVISDNLFDRPDSADNFNLFLLQYICAIRCKQFVNKRDVSCLLNQESGRKDDIYTDGH